MVSDLLSRVEHLLYRNTRYGDFYRSLVTVESCTLQSNSPPLKTIVPAGVVFFGGEGSRTEQSCGILYAVLCLFRTSKSTAQFKRDIL